MKKTAVFLRYLSAAATVLVLAALGFCCADIYIKGNLPSNLSESGVHLSPVYSREIVAACLTKLAPFFLIYALIVMAALVFQAIAPVRSTPLPINEEYRLFMAEKRVGKLSEEALSQRKQRRRIILIAAAALLVCALPPLAFLLNGNNFTSWEADAVLGALLRRLLPWLLLAFAVALAAAYAVKKSLLKELEILRACPPVPRAEPATAKDDGKKRLNILRGLVLAAALGLIVLGVMNGGARDVLIKAINICTECIGLG